MIEILKAILFGIVEGITEWLPVSSTGHMILLNEFVTMNVSEQFWNVFLVVIQLGAIMAVVILFWNKIWPFQTPSAGSGIMKKNTWILWGKIFIACIPAAVVGVLFDDFLDEHLYKPIVVALALIIFGIGFLAIENHNKGKEPVTTSLDDLTIKEVIIIGLFQLIAAIFPGTSRSGATILGGLLIGVSRTVATEFTFFLAIPVMFGASLLKVVKYIAEYGLSFTTNEIIVLITGIVVAFVMSIFVIKVLLGYIKNNDFKVFGYYRIILGILVILYFGLTKGIV